MDVSENSGTPKSYVLIGFFHYKPSILGYPCFWKHPCCLRSKDNRKSTKPCRASCRGKPSSDGWFRSEASGGGGVFRGYLLPTPKTSKKLRWNLKIEPWKRRHLFFLKSYHFGFHVSFQGAYPFITRGITTLEQPLRFFEMDGNKAILYFHAENWGYTILTFFFSNGLVQPPTIALNVLGTPAKDHRDRKQRDKLWDDEVLGDQTPLEKLLNVFKVFRLF